MRKVPIEMVDIDASATTLINRELEQLPGYKETVESDSDFAGMLVAYDRLGQRLLVCFSFWETEISDPMFDGYADDLIEVPGGSVRRRAHVGGWVYKISAEMCRKSRENFDIWRPIAKQIWWHHLGGKIYAPETDDKEPPKRPAYRYGDRVEFPVGGRKLFGYIRERRYDDVDGVWSYNVRPERSDFRVMWVYESEIIRKTRG